MKQQTNWYVITGGPGCGKTTTVNILKDRGYKTTIEHARHYLDTQLITGRTVDEVRSNQKIFQSEILKMQIEHEASLNPEDIVFLDRAIPDAFAYYRFLDLAADEKLVKVLGQTFYKKVFILAPLPLVNDYARTEDVIAQKRIHQLLIEVYNSLPFNILHVPVLTAEERVNLILKNL